MTNPPDYNTAVSFTAVRSSVVLAPGVCTIKLFTTVIYGFS